jgi:hypothetical protein
MGASGWSYFVPYQTDPNQALDELRQHSFASGDYYSPFKFLTMFVEQGLDQQMPQPYQLELRQDLEELRRQPAPQSIEELLERNETEGAHSILDISAVADRPAFGVVELLSGDDCQDMFGTAYPNRAMVEAKARELETRNGRWSGTCVIVYEANQPVELYFTGYSGD